MSRRRDDETGGYSGAIPYVGRFAPSPTGALHFGSVVAAIASYLDARTHQGRWLLRFDDLDSPRNAPGAIASITRELERLGLDWDGTPVYQSEHPQRYHKALNELAAKGLSYPCACSRKDLGGAVYPGTCRNGLAPGRTGRSRRLRVADTRIEFTDRIQGLYTRVLGIDPGDFIIHRADGIIAYHLATVLDDAEAGITHVVRGADLIASTPRQIYLQKCLGLAIPDYAHLPIAVNSAGRKLSKQTQARPSHEMDATTLWRQSLAFLGQPEPPPALQTVSSLCEHGLAHWRPDRVPLQRETELKLDQI